MGENEELKKICEKIFLNIERANWFFPISTTHLIEISKFSNNQVNREIIRLFKKQNIQMYDFSVVLKNEIILNSKEKIIRSSYFFRKYDVLPLPGCKVNIEVSSDNTNAKDIEAYRDMLMESLNDDCFEMIYNNDFSKLDKFVESNSDINKAEFDGLKEWARKTNLQIRDIFLADSLEILNHEKEYYRKNKDKYCKQKADRMYVVDSFRCIYGAIFKEKEIISKEIYNDDLRIYEFALKNNSFAVYTTLVLDLFSKDGKIDKNDFSDILFLSVAIPYCDIVIAEKTWTNIAINKKLDKKFNTKISKNLEILLDC